MLSTRKSIDIMKMLLNTIGSKKYTQDWCKENGITMDELEEFFNNSIKYSKLQAKSLRRRQK